jgi:hypothetical protein
VQFDHPLRAGPPKQIFTGNLPGMDGGEGEGRLESQGQHLLRGRKNILVANQQVKIDVAAHGRIAVSQKGNDWSFHQKRFDVRFREGVENAKQLRRHAQREKMLGAHAALQFFSPLLWHSFIVQLL